MTEPDPLLILQRQALEYRNKAEELRVTGDNTRSVEARGILLRLANDADRMAEKIEIEMRAIAARLER
jgi:hypothetical protein